MTRVGPTLAIKKIDVPGQLAGVAAMYACPRSECGMATMATFALGLYHGSVDRVERVEVIPRGQAQPMEDLPDEVAEDRREAWPCFFGGDRRAAVIMARAAVQRAVRTLDATGTNLEAEINDLRSTGVITEELRKWAHEVRFAGNDAAHPDTLGKVTEGDAAESLEFMDEFLRHTIAMPARRAAREADRSAQRSSP